MFDEDIQTTKNVDVKKSSVISDNSFKDHFHR